MQIIEHGKTQLQCAKCKYSWLYNGQLGYASCPNCRYNVKVAENKIMYEDKLGVKIETK